METQMNLALALGLATFGLGLLASVICLALLLTSAGKPRALSLALITFALAVAGFLIGAWLGILYFCSGSHAGNLCGLGGIFGTGPFASGLGLIFGAALMLKARQKARP